MKFNKLQFLTVNVSSVCFVVVVLVREIKVNNDRKQKGLTKLESGFLLACRTWIKRDLVNTDKPHL